MASVAGKQIALGHAQWRKPELRARWDATHASAVEGAGAAITAWAAEELNRVLVKELSEGENLYQC